MLSLRYFQEPVPKRSKVAYISSGDDECENGVGAGLKKSTSRPKRQRFVVSDSEEEEEYLASFPETQVKFIRKSESTAFVQNEEKARLHRLAEKQKQFNGIIFDDSTDDVDKAYELAFSEKKAAKRLILDNDKKHPVEGNGLLLYLPRIGCFSSQISSSSLEAAPTDWRTVSLQHDDREFGPNQISWRRRHFSTVLSLFQASNKNYLPVAWDWERLSRR